jgi:hypothetical protein
MSSSHLGSWQPLSLKSATDTFASARFRWWVAGGHALELHLERRWRTHGDTDISVLRNDLHAAYSLLPEWDIHIAAGGRLTPWHGEPLRVERHENNLWCRRNPAGRWILDIVISEGSDEAWIYRRDPSVQRSWDLAVLHSANGVPYLAPELQLLYKSKGRRPKDEADAIEVIPRLEDEQRAFLVRSLEPAHPWQRLLA